MEPHQQNRSLPRYPGGRPHPLLLDNESWTFHLPPHVRYGAEKLHQGSNCTPIICTGTRLVDRTLHYNETETIAITEVRMSFSRRGFLGSTATLLAAAGSADNSGSSAPAPASAQFTPVALKGNVAFSDLAQSNLSGQMKKAVPDAATGSKVHWGVPFSIDRPVLVGESEHREELANQKAGWLVFLHTADVLPLNWNQDGTIKYSTGIGRLGEHVADFVIEYADGTTETSAVRRRHHVGTFRRPWGENCFQAVPHGSPHPLRPVHEQESAIPDTYGGWGRGETRVDTNDQGSWVNWLWAWKNPHPGKRDCPDRFRAEGGWASSYQRSQPERLAITPCAGAPGGRRC